MAARQANYLSVKAHHLNLLRRREQRITSNEQFWTLPSSVKDQTYTEPHLRWSEQYLLDYAVRTLNDRFGEVGLVHVVGCGTGRELPAIRKACPAARIVASDISPDMLDACRAGLNEWTRPPNITLKCSPAHLLSPADGLADLVVTFNNMLTYVTPASEREITFDAFRRVLRPHGLLIGVVHHRWGRVSKSLGFLVQQVMNTLGLSRQELGDRIGGPSGTSIRMHYFTAAELRKLLSGASFNPEKVISLAALSRENGRRYKTLSSSNNLLFIGEAQQSRPR